MFYFHFLVKAVYFDIFIFVVLYIFVSVYLQLF